MTKLRQGIITLFHFLEKNEFQLIEKKYFPKSFGDYYYIYINQYLEVMIATDRSCEYITICRIDDKKEKFDLTIIKDMLQNEENLAKPESIDVSIVFLTEHLNEIMEVFSKEKYVETKKHLKTLQKIRVNQMFPGIFMQQNTPRNRAQVEKEADIAWRQKNFRKVVDLYGLFLSDLTLLQKKKYEYSLKKVKEL